MTLPEAIEDIRKIDWDTPPIWFGNIEYEFPTEEEQWKYRKMFEEQLRKEQREYDKKYLRDFLASKRTS